MSVNFEELDFRPTPMGVLSLRRRRQLSTGIDIYEIKLGDEFLMSSLFTAAEIELARLGLAALGGGRDLDVVVGGLGLGYTAQAVLENPGVRSLIVVDALAEVIEWHEQGLLPLGKQLTGDPRCRLVHGDFFAMTHSGEGYDPDAPRPPLRCGAGRYRSLAAQPAASAPCRAVCSRRGWRGWPRICIPAASLRCGRTIRRTTRSSACSAGAFATPAAHVVTFDNALGRQRSQQHRLCRDQSLDGLSQGNSTRRFSRLMRDRCQR